MIDYSACAFPKHRPAVIEQAAKASAHDRKLATAYTEVNLRDQNLCRVTGVELQANTTNEKRRREHHHLSGRNVKPEWTYRSERIILVSRLVHRLLEANALIAHGGDARKPIKFSWNPRIVKPGCAPLRLRPEVTA